MASWQMNRSTLCFFVGNDTAPDSARELAAEGRFATMGEIQDRLAAIAMRLLPTQVTGLPPAATTAVDTHPRGGSVASHLEMETMPAIPRMTLDDEDL